MDARYEETLDGGGTLRVRPHAWEIVYYFTGPDLRYKGRFVQFSGKDIPELIDAYGKAFQRYEELKATVPTGGQLELAHRMGLTIRVGGHSPGVCLASSHDAVSTRARLEQRLQSYRRAMSRAPAIQNMLLTLDDAK